jgi:hypothetical protein
MSKGVELPTLGDCKWLSAPMKERTCKWVEEDEAYRGECGVFWTFPAGSRQDNECTFCPKCGGRIVEVSAGSSANG